MMKLLKLTAVAASLCSAAVGQQALAQEDSEEVNNGTNPTLLANTFELKGGYIDAGHGFDMWTIEPSLTIPFGKKNVAFGVKVPLAQSVLDSSFDLGDVSAKFTHVVSVTPKNGIAYTVEFFADTASRSDIGYGEPVVEISGFYAFFLSNGSIFAPAVVQTLGLGGNHQTVTDGPTIVSSGDAGILDSSSNSGINTTTVDFYYVPRLSNPAYFMTLDPAIIRDWETKKTFGSLQVTFGRSIGKVGKGNLTLYARPQVLIGAERPANWGFEIGTKVIGF